MTHGRDRPDAPGWYADPEGVHEHEAYWDGTNWTGAVRAPPGALWSKRRTVGVVAAVLVGGALLIAAAGCVTGFSCTYDFTYLPALKADPMANLDLPGIRLINASNNGEGTVMGKPAHAKVGRTFRITDQGQAHYILDEAAAFAESHGWQIEADPTLTGETTYRGTKSLGPGQARLRLSLGVEDPLHNPDGPIALRISMRYRSGG